VDDGISSVSVLRGGGAKLNFLSDCCFFVAVVDL